MANLLPSAPFTTARVGVLVALSACLSFGACTQATGTDQELVSSRSDAVFTNGDFESGTNNTPPPSWTVTPYFNANAGVTIQTPQTRAGLNLQNTGTPAPTALTYTLVAAGGPGTQVDPSLGAAASFRWPKFGNAVAIVNRQGANHNVNSMKQTMTVAQGDIDSLDGLAHVRFVVAPVLQDPGHTANQQPYFYVQLINLTKGNAVLYQDFNFANQPGVPWKQNVAGTIRYTDWALVDIAPGSALLNIGDQVELELIAAGCSLGGHWGQLYVDGAGSTVPGIFVSGTAPAAANQNTNITYTLTYKNGGTAAAGGVVVEFNTPPNTTFTSYNAPGLTCTAPAAGSAGLVSCTVGALPAGGGGSFQITVHINNGTAGSVITAGNYYIQGTGISPLLGPKIYTNVTNNVTYADLGITKTDGVTSVIWGQAVTYTIVVTNKGPNAVTGATVSDPVPANLTNVSWTCAPSAGSTCTASGTGAIADTVNLPVGGTATYTVNGTVATGSGSATLLNIATATVPGGAVDPAPVDNSVGDSNLILSPNGIGCTQNADCVSGVCDPADSKCGWDIGHGPCDSSNAATVCRSGACSTALLCVPPGGCLVDADCAATQFCNTPTLACTPKLPNGDAVPSVAGHTNPVLDGTCSSGAVGTTVCVSGVCDPVDNKCGLANGDGVCDGTNGATICRSAVCDTADGKCGWDVGHGPCDSTNAGTVCRSGACSTSLVCMPNGGCLVDADCTADQFCNTPAMACVPKLANGEAVPSVAGHTNPTLDGTCSSPAVGTTVCVSAVCDSADNKCGYDVGHGPCDSTNAATVCRTGVCSVSGLCGPVGGCLVDGDCAATQYCDTPTFTCTAKLANGTPVPSVAGHTNPTLDGTCSSPAVGTAVCVSGVCDSADNQCGYADGHGPCDSTNGATVCRSGVCSSSGVCAPAGGCVVDGDCTSAQFCDTAAKKCTPKLANGVSIPTISGHTPALDGTCTTETGAIVCVSGVCDTADNKCGYANGHGPCTQSDATQVCRSQICVNGLCSDGDGGVPDAAKDGATDGAAKDGATDGAAKDGATDGAAKDGATDSASPGKDSAADSALPTDASGLPAVPGSLEGGGCACETGVGTSSNGGALALFALGFLVIARRRRDARV